MTRLFFEAAHRALAGAPWSAANQEEMLDIARVTVAYPRDRIAPSLPFVLTFAQVLFLATGDRATAESLWAEIRLLAQRLREPFLAVATLELDALTAQLEGGSKMRCGHPGAPW